MSVTSGKYFNNKTSFVGGAPRSNGTGNQTNNLTTLIIKSVFFVYLLPLPSSLTGQVVFFSKLKDNLFNVDLILSGEQFASSFGYSMISMDINGDRYVTLNHFITTIRISKSLKTVAYFQPTPLLLLFYFQPFFCNKCFSLFHISVMTLKSHNCNDFAYFKVANLHTCNYVLLSQTHTHSRIPLLSIPL